MDGLNDDLDRGIYMSDFFFWIYVNKIYVYCIYILINFIKCWLKY